MDPQIIAFTGGWIDRALEFSDKFIGENYYLREDLLKFTDNKLSFLLIDSKSEDVLGIRLSLPMGDWMDKENLKKIHPELWKIDSEKVGYFKTIFLSDKVRGLKFGQKLSERALEAFKQTGHKAVVCHSWNESPNDSSRRYLENLGFKSLVSISNFWKDIDYNCIRCGKPCVCSATEMICYL